ncbi:MAG: secondary thiamine-phosphate synthase enzyme YjbQ [Alphaproteobacteria bacterium]|nr:secondary thiamine-phosphate synthase enzyme YjbQ [Alphaproteobacteria bacterium]
MAHLQQSLGRLDIKTAGPGFIDVSAQVGLWLEDRGALDGLLTVFIRHTSASLVIQENADRDVQRDLMVKLDQLAPQNDGYAHDCEGPDDMPAHIKAMLTATSVAIPVAGGRMELGTWQGLYVVEHRARGHLRQLSLHFLGTVSR